MELFFLIPGHSHNIIDQKHSVIQKKWAGRELYSIEDWIKMIDEIPNFRAFNLLPHNYSDWLKPHLNPKIDQLMMNQVHVFRFTQQV